MKLLVLGAAVATALASVVLDSGNRTECTALLAHPAGDRVGHRDGGIWYDEAGKVIALDRTTRVMAASAGC